jgi:multiple sugar transport system substrate-binding protein
MKRRAWFQLMTAGIALLLAVGCVVREEESVVKLRITLWGSTAQQKLEESIVREFEKLNPQIKVELLVIGFNRYEEKLNSMMVGGIAPDLMLVNLSQYDNWASRGALADVTPVMEEISRDLTLLPGPEAAFRREGRFYGLPVNAHGFVTFVNLDAFAAAGIEVPETGFTWEEVFQFGPLLSKRAGATSAPTDYAIVPPFYSYAVLVEFGGALFDDLYDPQRVTIASAAGEAWIEWLRQLEQASFAASRAVVTDAGTYQLFRDGRAALYFAGRWQVPDFTGTTAFRWDVRPFPAGPKGRVTYSGGTALGISPKSKHPEEARLFAKFYAGRAGSELSMKGGRVVPVYRELAEAPAFLDLKPPASPHHFVDTMKAGAATAWLYAPGSHDVWDIVNARIEEALADTMLAPSEVTRRMAADLERWLVRQRRLGKLHEKS